MDILNNLFAPYQAYSPLQIGLEAIAAATGIVSVIFAIFKRIWVYPLGIVSTVIYTYLLFSWGLYGDMLINGYYTVMSLYGWWSWMENIADNDKETPKQEFILNQMAFCLIGGFVLVSVIYFFKYGSIQNIPFMNWIDAICTCLFLVAMFLMAKKRVENWLFWIAGNSLAIYLFYSKGYTITSIQYIVFLLLAIWGWIVWNKSILKF